jgi:hypothetical protein
MIRTEKCSSCIHKDACAAWIRHGETLYDDFAYSVEDCPYYGIRCEKCRYHFCVDDEDICRRPGLSGEMIVTPDGFCAWGESRNGSI